MVTCWQSDSHLLITQGRLPRQFRNARASGHNCSILRDSSCVIGRNPSTGKACSLSSSRGDLSGRNWRRAARHGIRHCIKKRMPCRHRTAAFTSSSHVHLGDGMEHSKGIQEPQDDSNHHSSIQNPLNGILHRYKPIDDPEKNTHHDQYDCDVN